MQSKYDSIVIGAGNGGLTAGALLAKNGQNVLIADQFSSPGGYLQNVEKDGFSFDMAVHLIAGASKDGVVPRVLQHLNVANDVTFIKPDVFYKSIFPDFSITAPWGLDNFTEAHVQAFPDEGDNIVKFIQQMNVLYGEVQKLNPTMSLLDFVMMPFRSPNLFKYHRRNYQWMLDTFLKTKKSKNALSTIVGYSGLMPPKLSSIVMSAILIMFVVEGGYYVKGGFGKITDALSKSFNNSGGTLLLNKEVSKMTIESNSLKSVQFTDGSLVQANNVIVNISPIQFFSKIFTSSGKGNRYLKYSKILAKPSPTPFTVYIGTDLNPKDYNLAHESFAVWDFEKNGHDFFQKSINPELDSGVLGIYCPSISGDDSRSPAGQYSIFLVALAPGANEEDWQQIKNKIADDMIKKVEQIIPDLSKHIVSRKVFTPSDMRHRSLNDNGAAYGWAKDTNVSKLMWLFSNFPKINGLYFTGHWASMEQGIKGGMETSVGVAQQILKSQILH